MTRRPKTLTVPQLKKMLLKKKGFREEYEKQLPKYQIARQVIEARLKSKLTQAELAKKINTGQAVISRLEGLNAKPSISLLTRIATALETKIHITVGP